MCWTSFPPHRSTLPASTPKTLRRSPRRWATSYQGHLSFRADVNTRRPLFCPGRGDPRVGRGSTGRYQRVKTESKNKHSTVGVAYANVSLDFSELSYGMLTHTTKRRIW